MRLDITAAKSVKHGIITIFISLMCIYSNHKTSLRVHIMSKLSVSA